MANIFDLNPFSNFCKGYENFGSDEKKVESFIKGIYKLKQTAMDTLDPHKGQSSPNRDYARNGLTNAKDERKARWSNIPSRGGRDPNDNDEGPPPSGGAIKRSKSLVKIPLSSTSNAR